MSLVDVKKVKRNAVDILLAGIARYPFWDAVSTMMMFAEIENQGKKKVDLPKFVIFADAGLLILMGTFMSFKPNTRRVCATISAVQLVVRTALQYSLHGNISDPIFTHILLRNLGVVGAFFILASGIGETRAKRTTLFNLACVTLGLLFAWQAGLLLSSRFEQKFVAYYLPRQVLKILNIKILTSFLAVCMAICAIYFIFQSKRFVVVKKFVTVFWLCLCLPGDITAISWIEGVMPWTIYRLSVSSVCTFAGLLVIYITEC